jgi:quercetin dioxygenase-like cupin family protein
VRDGGALLVYVLDGRLHLDVGGMRETLETGDCAYLESDMPLAWGAAGKQRCRLLTVTPSLKELAKETTKESEREAVGK